MHTCNCAIYRFMRYWNTNIVCLTTVHFCQPLPWGSPQRRAWFHRSVVGQARWRPPVWTEPSRTPAALYDPRTRGSLWWRYPLANPSLSPDSQTKNTIHVFMYNEKVIRFLNATYLVINSVHKKSHKSCCYMLNISHLYVKYIKTRQYLWNIFYNFINNKE